MCLVSRSLEGRKLVYQLPVARTKHTNPTKIVRQIAFWAADTSLRVQNRVYTLMTQFRTATNEIFVSRAHIHVLYADNRYFARSRAINKFFRQLDITCVNRCPEKKIVRYINFNVNFFDIIISFAKFLRLISRLACKGLRYRVVEMEHRVHRENGSLRKSKCTIRSVRFSYAVIFVHGSRNRDTCSRTGSTKFQTVGHKVAHT